MKITLSPSQQSGSTTTRILLCIIAALLIVDIAFRDNSIFKAISPAKHPASPKQTAASQSANQSSSVPQYDATRFHTVPNQPFVPLANVPPENPMSPLARPGKTVLSTPRQMTQVVVVDSGKNVDANSLHSGNPSGSTQAQLPPKKGNQVNFPGMNWGPPLPVALPGQQYNPAIQTATTPP